MDRLNEEAKGCNWEKSFELYMQLLFSKCGFQPVTRFSCMAEIFFLMKFVAQMSWRSAVNNKIDREYGGEKEGNGRGQNGGVIEKAVR